MPSRFVSSIDVRLNCRPRHVTVYVIRISGGRAVAVPEGPPSAHSFQFALVPGDTVRCDQENAGSADQENAGRAGQSGPASPDGRRRTSSLTILSYGGLDTRTGSAHSTLSPRWSQEQRELFTAQGNPCAVLGRTTSRTNYQSTCVFSISSLIRGAHQELLHPDLASTPRDDQARVYPLSDSGLATDVSLSESTMSECWSGVEALTPGVTPAVTPRSMSGGSLWPARGEEPLELTLWDMDTAHPNSSSTGLYGQSGHYGRREWWSGSERYRSRSRRRAQSKERELQAALQRQERYQLSVQQLTAKMEHCSVQLADNPATMAAPLDTQIREFKETLSEIEDIRSEIGQARERGEQLMDSPDSEGAKALQSTLTMLEDRFRSLQALADDKGRQLQQAKTHKERHALERAAYEKRVAELREWLEEAKVRHASLTLPSDDPARLQEQVDQSKVRLSNIVVEVVVVEVVVVEVVVVAVVVVAEIVLAVVVVVVVVVTAAAVVVGGGGGGVAVAVVAVILVVVAAVVVVVAAVVVVVVAVVVVVDIQEEVNVRLRQVSDLALQCDAVCEHEPPNQAERLRNQLAQLQKELGDLKMSTIKKQAELRASIKDSEKRRREREEVDTNVARLQKWMSDTKEMTKPTEFATTTLPSDIHKELFSDIKQHRQLVRQISDRKLRSAPPAGLPAPSDREVRNSWERLSRHLAQKRDNLQAILRTSKPGELAQISLHAPTRQADSANQLSEVKSIMGEMSTTWRELQTQLDEKKLSLDDAMTFQQQYQSALQGVSSWLDLAQQQLFTVPSTTEEHIRHNENLQKQLKTLQAEVTDMSDQGEELLTSTDPSNRDLVEACLTSLDDRLQLLAESAQGQAEDLRGAERDWRQYQDDVKELKVRLQDTQRLLLVQAPAGSSLDAMVENNQKIEAQLKKCELQLSELKAKEASLTLAYPKGVFPSELATLQTNFLDLNRRAMEKKAILQQSTSVQDQYQKMLNDYSAFLNTAQDKLRTDSISARDLPHLKQQLAAHKDFFSDLEVHQAMLTALADQCDSATRARLQSQHAPLMSLTHVLVDQASLHGQRYKRLQTELADERASVFEVVDKGKQILHSVNCPALEGAVTSLADTWVDLNTDLTHELKRTETLGDQLSIFETEAAVLTSWLAAAKTKLNSFKQLSTSDLSNIGAVRTKVEKLLEFRKEIENQAPLRDRVLKAGQKLLLNQNYDTRGLSERLDNYESEWCHLEEGAARAGEFLHQRQMELMPSRQAMTELTSWINQINKHLEEDAKRRVKTVADIEVMVKKYKGYRVEVTSKQMTLDFVNQSELAPQPEDENVTHEKLEFAEKLGEVNKNWVKVVKAINDRLASLEVKRYKLIGHEVGVRQTLKDCKTLQQQLQAKQADLTAVTSLGQRLVELSRESPGCQQSVRDSLDALHNTWTHLEEQTRQLENLLTDMLGQWARYHTDLASLNQMLTQIEYALSQYTLIGGDIHTLRSQVNKLKNLILSNRFELKICLCLSVSPTQKLQSEQQASAGHLEAFSNLSGQLRQVCEPPVQLDVQKTVSDVQTRWKQVAKDLADRLAKFDGCLSLWQSYENKHSHLLAWLDSREALCSGLITMRADPDKQADALSRGKSLQQELDQAQSQLSELYRLSDQLTGTMDPSTIATLTARQSGLEQRMVALRQVLQQHLAGLTDDLSMLGRFNQAFQVVEKFLTYAAQILAPADPGKSDEESVLKSRLEQLRQLLLLFNTNFVKLDDVNELGYRLALKDVDAKRLLDLNHRWQHLYEDANERSRSLQGHLLVQQDFTAKCEAWMTFLAHTETDLAREIKGNLKDLQDQLRRCEQFESEMYSNQQILHAIISDGQKMMRAGEVDDVEEFQQKLQLLSEQWHSVTRRANQRRSIIEGLIAKWQQFKASSDQLKSWLRDKEAAMASLEFDSDSLQVIRNLSQKIKVTQHEFDLHEATFKRIHDLAGVLQQHADQAASREIKSTLSELQELWKSVFSSLDDQRAKLEGVDRQWLDCEDDISEMLAWLQEIRRVLYADIPTTHDAIQEDINKCRDITSSFASAENKRQSLLSRERRLGRLVQTEDMNLLHQRIRLLNKQWEELRHQASLREQRLTEALFRWTNLGERIRALMTWIEDMETKITTTRDMHVEDLLAKLENEYKIEMNEKEHEKKEVVSQGKQLMKVSSEIRASDIEQKILRLEDKWSHLVSVMDFRHRKLQETVLAVKQLDTSMKNLSRWLSQVESQLSGGLEFKDVGLQEIQSKLQDTQELQEDIEQHSAGVSAVLNLCEVLLHDHDACPTQTEFLALQHAMKNLEKRWRNICSLSPRRRTRVEETWGLWEQFRTDCRLFSDWLSQIEEEVRESEIEIRDVALAKQEISKYETLQRNVHDHLAQLENINRQYRQLAKDGRTDTDGQLRVAMTDLNNRWDAVQIKVTEIMKKLRHSATIRQDFEETRTSLISWLREVDSQLTDILHRTDLDLGTKVTEIRHIEDEVHTKRHRMDYLDQAGVYLMQKGDSQEALTVQAQLEDFRLLSSQVLERVVTTQLQVERLVVEQQVEDVAELEKVESARRHQESSADRIRELRDAQTTVILERQTAELERYLEESPPESPPAPRRQDASPSRVTVPTSRYSHSPVRPPTLRSTSPSPVRTRQAGTRPDMSTSSTAAGPLAIDTSQRSRSPSKVMPPTSRASGSPMRRMSPSPSRRSPLPSRLRQDVTDGRASPTGDIGQLERSAKLEVLMEQLVEGLDDCDLKLARLEQSMGSRPGRKDLDQQVQLLVECEVAVDGVTRLHRLLKTESGVSSIASADAQVKFVTKRWEQLQRRAMDRETRLSQHHHDLSNLEADVDTMLAWLDEAEALQRSLRTLPDDIGQLDRVVRQYKDFLVQLESRKPTVLSINLLSRTHLASRGPETKSVRVKVQEMNHRWDQVLARAEEIQIDIQSSLLRCQEFHHTIDDYQDWLEGLETRVRQLEPLNLNQDEAALWSKYTVLVDTHSELQRNQSKVLSTKETADQLLVTSDSPNMCAARDSIHSIHKRMRSLMHLTAAYISSLENKLNIRPTRGSASSSLDLSEGRSSGLGSSHASRSSTPLRPGSSTTLRTRARSPFAVSRQFPDSFSISYSSLIMHQSSFISHQSSFIIHQFHKAFTIVSLLPSGPQLLAGIFGPLLRSVSLLHPHNLSTGYETSPAAKTAGPSRLLRVIRAALPIQLLLLLLLLLACLVPVCEDEHSCLLSNNLRHSFSPMLRYTDGAPPT
ncbi:nesprin-1-like [Elysia marginata]|uniref:Nesprin-1-like n=1 Tax=Elysia marginata TaxID=1093978 RepID=A0AAV4GHD0_9GAST|nr:nesprin-1-like [Elysia marginata]